MRNEDNYLHCLADLRMIAEINAMLRAAVSVRTDTRYTDTDRAWFRAPIKGGK